MWGMSMTLAVAAGIIAAKALERATENSIDAASDAAGQASRSVLEWIRRRPDTSRELARLEKTPTDQTRIDDLTEVIDAVIVNDPTAAEELQQLVDQAHNAGVIITTNTHTGDNQVGDVTAKGDGAQAIGTVEGNIENTYTFGDHRPR